MQVLSTGSDARAHLPAHGRDHRIDLHSIDHNYHCLDTDRRCSTASRSMERDKEIVLVSSLGSATGGNRRFVLALKSGWSIRKRWRSSWRKATGLSSSPSPP